MVSVISRVLDSINVLEKLRELCKVQVDYVVVKNLFHGEEVISYRVKLIGVGS